MVTYGHIHVRSHTCTPVRVHVYGHVHVHVWSHMPVRVHVYVCVATHSMAMGGHLHLFDFIGFFGAMFLFDSITDILPVFGPV